MPYPNPSRFGIPYLKNPGKCKKAIMQHFGPLYATRIGSHLTCSNRTRLSASRSTRTCPELSRFAVCMLCMFFSAHTKKNTKRKMTVYCNILTIFYIICIFCMFFGTTYICARVRKKYRYVLQNRIQIYKEPKYDGIAS